MAEEFQFTPEQVGQMTLYQMRMLTLDKKQLGPGRYRMNKEEFGTWKVKKKGRPDTPEEVEWAGKKRARYQQRVAERHRALRKKQREKD